MRTTTIKELGTELPIGFLSEKSNQLVKSFSLRPYQSWVDRRMNTWREANQGKPGAWLVAKFLSLIVEEAGGHHFKLDDNKDSSDALLVKILDWNFADVLYMYMWARIQVCDQIVVTYGCTNVDCSLQSAEKLVDLTSIEVVCAEAPNETKFWVDLRDGFKLANRKVCRGLELKAIPFRVVLLPGASQGSVDDSLGYNQMREVVVNIKGEDAGYILSDAELDEMSKWDQMLINAQAGKITAGLKLRTTLLCDKCKQPIVRALDWSFDHFFDSSIPVQLLMS